MPAEIRIYIALSRATQYNEVVELMTINAYETAVRETREFALQFANRLTDNDIAQMLETALIRHFGE